MYRAAVRVVMRLVVVLFAESRDLLPRDNALYHSAYGVGGLFAELEKVAARGGDRLARSWSAWPRLLALFRLVHQGSHHPALPVPAYGGELFAPAREADGMTADGLTRALHVFETAAFDASRGVFPDRDVHRLLEKVSRTRIRLRQGRQNTLVTVPVDFSDLSSEYIGILYEGLLDFELTTAPPGDPVVFLAVGNQPALPLSRLEGMDDRSLSALLEKMKDTSSAGDVEQEADSDDAATSDESEEEATDSEDADDLADDAETEVEATDEVDAGTAATAAADHRHITRTRAEVWARRAVEIGGMVSRPRGRLSPERQRAHDDTVSLKAKQLVVRVVLPGEWYLVRWGGTRKGSGTFYTRPGLAVPTVQRTLRPLAYVAPTKENGALDADAPASAWTPKPPEQILELKVCDPACGSGTFPVAALRFLTEALYASVHQHKRVADRGDVSIVSLLRPSEPASGPGETLGQELLPCRADDFAFEPRLKAVLRRYVVERCIYGVDLDPLAVELCRLALWIETMDRTLPFSFLDHKIKCGNALVGAWFDTFRHYPVMAFKNREGGDKGHSDGVHFEKDARGKALRVFAAGVLKDDLARFLSGPTLFDPRDQATEAASVHDEMLALLARLHEMPVHDAAERANVYRTELLGSPAYQQLKDAMDLWCACWFWPVEKLDCAPLPSSIAMAADAQRQVAARIVSRLRFFHWELEFPDVFRSAGSGFDSVLGNPPWETLQPNSMEYFSNLDPLYRAYGKQEALKKQKDLFCSLDIERGWLDYNASFAGYSNWVKHAASAFGDPTLTDASSERFGVARGSQNAALHSRWRELRTISKGYADPAHPYEHRGEGKAYTYKLFIELAHALLRPSGRLGFIVPSGLYSDHGTRALRRLLLDQCRWEWLFNFINWSKIFTSVYYRFKFNAIVVEKGGRTETIKTAFVRTQLDDWERAEKIAVPYTREQVERFSPTSRTILEIQSARDLEVLEKIYAHSELLGDDDPAGRRIKYIQGDFNMTSDSKLFPPRPVWEAKGYRPDEYSRWLLGLWRPIGELWPELCVDPSTVVPAEVALEDWLFDSAAGPERRSVEARLFRGHLLKPGDVARTPWRVRCAQPPYDALPISRADLPPGIILSRDGDAWIRETDVDDVALPLYEGRMFAQLNPNQKGWVSGKGRGAVWEEFDTPSSTIRPQYLLRETDYVASVVTSKRGTSIMDVTSATNARTTVASVTPPMPHGHSAPKLLNKSPISLAGLLSSITLDWCARKKQSGLHLVWAVLEDLPLPKKTDQELVSFARIADSLSLITPLMCIEALRASNRWHTNFPNSSLFPAERKRNLAILDALAAALFGIGAEDISWILRQCDFPADEVRSRMKAELDPNGFWRVDKRNAPELRQTILTVIAFNDLQKRIDEHDGDVEQGVTSFLSQNDGEGWMLPETLRLSEYGLGHDERARFPQPVASQFGPRFYDWQLVRSSEEAWRECQLHARNQLGDEGYRQLLAEIEAERSVHTAETMPRVPETVASSQQRTLFD